LIDSGADLNCIQEGLIPRKYFEKSNQRLNSATGTKLQINYELNNVHVYQDGVYFHIPSVLVKNMSDKVILGIPFIFMLYPFKARLGEVSTVKMGVPVKFHFASRFEIDISQLSLSLAHARTLHCLDIPSEIVETNASKIDFGGILKQLASPRSPEQVRFHYGSWNFAQYNYSTIIKKFFLLFKNIAFKQISAFWQAILSTFGFNKEYVKSSDNLIPDFPCS
jgi:hypothetical protein